MASSPLTPFLSSLSNGVEGRKDDTNTEVLAAVEKEGSCALLLQFLHSRNSTAEPVIHPLLFREYLDCGPDYATAALLQMNQTFKLCLLSPFRSGENNF